MRSMSKSWMCGAVAMVSVATAAQASMTLLSGPPVGTHVGNLVTNGSFEIGAPAPGSANYRLWATGTMLSGAFGVPGGWSSSGQTNSYAYWGSDFAGGPYVLRSSGVLPDGVVGMYFGNAISGVSPAPTPHPDGTFTFSSTPTFTPAYGGPVRLWQSVPTHLTPAASYVLSFWASSEGAFSGTTPGLFGLKVTNVITGDPITYLRSPGLGGKRYEFSFVPLNPLAPVTVEFINWGHIDLSPYGGGLTSELVMDDVIVNAVPEPASAGLLAIGLLALRRRGC